MESLGRVLRGHPFLAGFEPGQVDFLVGCAANRRYQPGEFLFREGEAAQALHLIRQGRVALEMHVPGRGTVVLETLEPGDALGIDWLYAPYCFSLDARAVDTVLAFAFDTDCVRRKMEEEPAFGCGFYRHLLERVAERLQRVRLQRVDLYRQGL